MDSLSSVEGGLYSNPGGTLLDGRLLHDYSTDSSSVCGRLLGSTPATRRYMVRTSRIKTQDFAVFCEVVSIVALPGEGVPGGSWEGDACI